MCMVREIPIHYSGALVFGVRSRVSLLLFSLSLCLFFYFSLARLFFFFFFSAALSLVLFTTPPLPLLPALFRSSVRASLWLSCTPSFPALRSHIQLLQPGLRLTPYRLHLPLHNQPAERLHSLYLNNNPFRHPHSAHCSRLPPFFFASFPSRIDLGKAPFITLQSDSDLSVPFFSFSFFKLLQPSSKE